MKNRRKKKERKKISIKEGKKKKKKKKKNIKKEEKKKKKKKKSNPLFPLWTAAEVPSNICWPFQLTTLLKTPEVAVGYESKREKKGREIKL